MTVRQRILLLQATVLAFTVGMIAVVLVGLRLNDGFIRRIDGVHRRFEAIAELDGSANNYAEQIAEVLLLGEEQMDDFRAAKGAMEAGFAKLRAVTRDEVGTLTGLQEAQAELGDVESAVRLEELSHAIARAAERIFALQRQGRQAEATALFRDEVEYRLANDFERMIEEALSDERAEVTTELRQIRGAQNRLLAVAVALSLAAVGACAGLGVLIARNIVGPVRRLTEGAQAVAAGNLSHRVAPSGTGEFALLSGSFNAMAEALEAQQRRLTAARDHLEAEVAQRTRDLTSANERLKGTDEQRAQFLADVSHELRTPLTVVRGEADVSLRGALKPAEHYRQTLERIQAQAVSMGSLLEDLLAFARAEAEDLSFAPEPFDLRAVVREAVADCAVLAHGTDIGVEAVEAPSPIEVCGDRQRLKQVLMIGIDNAVKYSGNLRGVRVLTQRMEDEAVVRIKDEGVGLRPGEETRVFERFYRGGGGDGTEGLGIGLAIARNIVQRHGGRITLANRASGGAVLTVALPLRLSSDGVTVQA